MVFQFHLLPLTPIHFHPIPLTTTNSSQLLRVSIITLYIFKIYDQPFSGKSSQWLFGKRDRILDIFHKLHVPSCSKLNLSTATSLMPQSLLWSLHFLNFLVLVHIRGLLSWYSALSELPLFQSCIWRFGSHGVQDKYCSKYFKNKNWWSW